MRMASFGPILVVTAFHKPPCPFKDHLYFNIMLCINKTRKKKGDTHLGPNDASGVTVIWALFRFLPPPSSLLPWEVLRCLSRPLCWSTHRYCYIIVSMYIKKQKQKLLRARDTPFSSPCTLRPSLVTAAATATAVTQRLFGYRGEVEAVWWPMEVAICSIVALF